MRHLFAHVYLAVILLLTVVGEAKAGNVTIRMTGIVEQVGSRVTGGPIMIGDPVTLTYTFDSESVDTIADPFIGVYEGAITDMRVELPNYTATATSGDISGPERQS